MSRVDRSALRSICTNDFDTDLLLLCGDIESNPGPRSTFTDSFGNRYIVMKMSGSGFFGFHCLSYCLSGQPAIYGDIIEDCIHVFTNIEELFRLRTNYGSDRDSS